MRTAPPARLAELAAQQCANMAVHLAHLRGRRGAPAADGPDRLVGNDDLAFRRLGQGPGYLGLPTTDRAWPASRSASVSPTQTIGTKPCGQGRVGLGAHQSTALPVIAAPLGVAENDVTAAGVRQHGRGDIARMRARLGRVAVLGAQLNRTAGQAPRRPAEADGTAGRPENRSPSAGRPSRPARPRAKSGPRRPGAHSSSNCPRSASAPWRPRLSFLSAAFGGQKLALAWQPRRYQRRLIDSARQTPPRCPGRPPREAAICRLPGSGPLPKMRPPQARPVRPGADTARRANGQSLGIASRHVGKAAHNKPPRSSYPSSSEF